MDRLSRHVLTVWRTVVLASLLAWLVGGSRPVQAQDLDLGWATSVSSAKHDAGSSIAVDHLGNRYVTGFVNNHALFGPGEAHQITITLTDPGASLFLAKYDQRGQVVWAQAIDNRNPIPHPQVAVDGAGHAYVTYRSWDHLPAADFERLLSL